MTGTPEILRVDADLSGDVKIYLLDVPFSTTGVLMQSYFHPGNQHGLEVTKGQAVSYVPSVDGTTGKVRFYVKFVMRDATAVVERFLLQVANV